MAADSLHDTESVVKALVEHIQSAKTESKGLLDQWRGLGFIQNSSKFLMVDWVNNLSKATKIGRSMAEVLEGIRDTTATENKHLEATRTHWKTVQFTTGLFLFALKKSLDITAEWNRSLSFANGVVEKRRELLTDIYKVQNATGASSKDMSEIVQDMIGYGLEAKGNFVDTMVTATKLHMALGLSSKEVADLAIMSDRMGVSFKGIADTLVRIVDSTALSAQEAQKYADQLGRAALYLNKGGRQSFGGAGGGLEVVERLEGAIKEAGGTQGDFTKMASEMMSTLEGGMQAQVFGLNPGALATGAGSKGLFDQLTNFVEAAQKTRDSGNTLGYVAMLEQFRMMTGDRLSMDTMNSLVEARKKLNSQNVSALDLDKKWLNEIKNTGKAWESVRDMLMSVVHDGLWPAVWGLRQLLGGLQYVLSAIRKVDGLFTIFSYTAMGAAVVAVGLFTRKMYQLVNAFIWASRQANEAIRNIAQNSGMPGVPGGVPGGIPGGGGTGSGIWKNLTSVFRKTYAGPGGDALGHTIGARTAMPLSTLVPALLGGTGSIAAITAIAGAAIVGLAGGAAVGLLLRQLSKTMGHDSDSWEIWGFGHKDINLKTAKTSADAHLNYSFLDRFKLAMQAEPTVEGKAGVYASYTAKNKGLSDMMSNLQVMKSYQESLLNHQKEAAFGRIQMGRSTTAEIEKAEHDRQLIDLLKAVAANTASTDAKLSHMATISANRAEIEKDRITREALSKSNLERANRDLLHVRP